MKTKVSWLTKNPTWTLWGSYISVELPVKNNEMLQLICEDSHLKDLLQF